jgi:hypothetical protein
MVSEVRPAVRVPVIVMFPAMSTLVVNKFPVESAFAETRFPVVKSLVTVTSVGMSGFEAILLVV